MLQQDVPAITVEQVPSAQQVLQDRAVEKGVSIAYYYSKTSL